MGALLFCEQGEADRNRHSPDNYGPFEKFGSKFVRSILHNGMERICKYCQEKFLDGVY